MQTSYTLQRSERQWSAGWVPWDNDRLHQLRFSTVFRPSHRTTISASHEGASGQPYTPIVRFDTTSGRYQTMYGSENSARGKAMVRLDAAIQREMAGPFGTELSVGLSITNLSLGDQAPRKGIPRFINSVFADALPDSQTLFDLPPIPSLLLRVRF